VYLYNPKTIGYASDGADSRSGLDIEREVWSKKGKKKGKRHRDCAHRKKAREVQASS